MAFSVSISCLGFTFMSSSDHFGLTPFFLKASTATVSSIIQCWWPRLLLRPTNTQRAFTSFRVRLRSCRSMEFRPNSTMCAPRGAKIEFTKCPPWGPMTTAARENISLSNLQF